MELKRAAIEAIDADINQYSITWGDENVSATPSPQNTSELTDLTSIPKREITVCCGATEGMIASLLAVTNPGDEVIVFEPFYENYGPDTQNCAARCALVHFHAPDWSFDPDELRRAFSPRTKAIIVNTPNNPTGKVFAARSWN